MPFSRRSAGSWIALTTVKRRASGAWVTPTAVKRRSGGTWVTVWPTFTPVTRTYASGSGVETAPLGATQIRIGVFQGGYGGDAGAGGSTGGRGGASGRYSESVYALDGSGTQTVNYVVGNGGTGGTYPSGTGNPPSTPSTVTSGTLSITTINASGGGNVKNDLGNSAPIPSGPSAQPGGAALNETVGGVVYTKGAGGSGGSRFGDGGNGALGYIIIYYT